MSSPQRLFGLDLLRAFAILVVVYGHGEPFIGHHFPHYAWLEFDGVSIFFVLSGFLIGGILIKLIERREVGAGALLSFWSRRWLRTLPAYLVVLLLLLALYVARNDRWPDQALSYFMFAQNLASPHPLFFPEAWSLAVEEWFYLLVPLGIFCTLRWTGLSTRATLLGWLVGVIIAVTAFRLFRIQQHDLTAITAWDTVLRKQVFTRLDAIMFGFLGAYLRRFHAAAWARHAGAWLLLGLALLLVDRIAIEWSVAYRSYLTFTVVSAAVLMLLPRLNTLPTPRHRLFRAIGFISAISYSMYLLNLSVVRLNIIPWLVQVLPSAYTRDALVYLAYWAITIGLSWLLYRGVEQPFLRLRDRWTRAEHARADLGLVAKS